MHKWGQEQLTAGFYLYIPDDSKAEINIFCILSVDLDFLNKSNKICVTAL